MASLQALDSSPELEGLTEDTWWFMATNYVTLGRQIHLTPELIHLCIYGSNICSSALKMLE